MAIIQCKRLHHPAIRAFSSAYSSHHHMPSAKRPIIPAKADICLSNAVSRKIALQPGSQAGPGTPMSAQEAVGKVQVVCWVAACMKKARPSGSFSCSQPGGSCGTLWLNSDPALLRLLAGLPAIMSVLHQS